MKYKGGLTGLAMRLYDPGRPGLYLIAECIASWSRMAAPIPVIVSIFQPAKRRTGERTGLSL